MKAAGALDGNITKVVTESESVLPLTLKFVFLGGTAKLYGILLSILRFCKTLCQMPKWEKVVSPC